MKKTPWKMDFFTITIVIFSSLLLYKYFNYGQIAIIIILSSYIVLTYFKLYKVYHWLNKGMLDDEILKNKGIIGSIVTQMQLRKKNIEKSKNQQQKILKHFNNIISAIPIATVIINKNNEIEWANHPALSLLGINGKRDIGIKIDRLLRETNFSQKLSTGNGEEFEMNSPIDNNIILAVQMAKYANDKLILLAHNISPNVEIQHSRKTFIANASHELRTPLTVISGYLEFIYNTPNLADDLHIPVKKALEQSANMKMIIDDLLTISHLENKTLHPELVTKINLKNHLHTLLQTLAASSKKQQSIIVNVREKLYIKASQKELDSVCYNIINNAIKYSEKNSKIIITWEKINKAQLKFSVQDHGIGIAPEHIPRLTERFYRVDKGRSRKIGGTGLGLCIVKHILERHQGYLEINSRLGEGSTFAAIFPINPLQNNIRNHN